MVSVSSLVSELGSVCSVIFYYTKCVRQICPSQAAAPGKGAEGRAGLAPSGDRTRVGCPSSPSQPCRVWLCAAACGGVVRRGLGLGAPLRVWSRLDETLGCHAMGMPQVVLCPLPLSSLGRLRVCFALRCDRYLTQAAFHACANRGFGRGLGLAPACPCWKRTASALASSSVAL